MATADAITFIKKRYHLITMTRFIAAILVPALALLSASCGCKKELSVPPLRDMPEFSHPSYNPAPQQEQPVIVPTK